LDAEFVVPLDAEFVVPLPRTPYKNLYLSSVALKSPVVGGGHLWINRPLRPTGNAPKAIKAARVRDFARLAVSWSNEAERAKDGQEGKKDFGLPFNRQKV
jgi:hypothetical protein